jgi:hypothetical protein
MRDGLVDHKLRSNPECHLRGIPYGESMKPAARCARVPLDKSEGVVKAEISWALRAGLVPAEKAEAKALESHRESHCGPVSPTIDST